MTRADRRKLGAGLLFIGSFGELISVAVQQTGMFRLATECVAAVGILVWASGAIRR
jgi:hypothetical protein